MENSESEMFYEELPDSSEANDAKWKSKHSRNNTLKEEGAKKFRFNFFGRLIGRDAPYSEGEEDEEEKVPQSSNR